MPHLEPMVELQRPVVELEKLSEPLPLQVRELFCLVVKVRCLPCLLQSPS